MNVGSLGKLFDTHETAMFEMTKTPTPSTPMDSNKVSELMCGQVLCTVVCFGPYLLPSRLTDRTHLIFLQKVLANYSKMCHWTSVDASAFNTMEHHPILQAWYVVTLNDVSDEDG